ncbi:MAG: hypothetical protein AAGK02_04335 [Pseudomonadota bacterium]
MRSGKSLKRLRALCLATTGLCFVHPSFLAAQEQPAENTEPAVRNDRVISFTVPLVYEGRVLGDVFLEVYSDNSVGLDTTTLREEFNPLLNEAGIEALNRVTDGRVIVDPERLGSIGIELEFNQNLLQIDVNEIDGELRPVRQLVDSGSSTRAGDIALLEPAHFSAYLNLNSNVDYNTDTDEFSPELFLDGGARLGDVALEYNGAISDQFGEGTRFYRRGVRAVYDRREKFQRFAAGDLRLETLGLLRTPFLGGVSFEKSRRVFDPFTPAARLGAGEIFLDNNSTVDVVINGDLYQTLELDAGTYDLASLPVQLGSNDVELQIRDSGGREQSISLDYFYQPLDLVAGEEEYSFALGMIARDLAFEPEYTDDPAFVGLYRKALSDDVILGGALQISEDVQLVGAEATVVPQFIPGFFDVEGAASFSDLGGTAFSARASYRLSSGNSFTNQSTFSINVDYSGAGFTTISNVAPIQFDLLTFSASYNRAISEEGRIVSGAIYSHRAGPQDDLASVFVDYIHRLNDRLQLVAGVEYGNSDAIDDNWGFRIGVSYVFGRNIRGSADYRSRTDTSRANLTKGSDNKVGSYGYDVGFISDADQTRADFGFDYVANRFDTRLSMFSEGSNIGNITDEQRFRFQFGTSLALADGQFAVGRPIRDAFAIVHPHSSLEDGQVIVGRDLSDNTYEARSGTFGGALQGRLSSYADQTIQYDVDGAGVGYDIGEGVARVDPPLRGGYSLQVGSDNFVSVVGTLRQGGEPVSLIAGRVEALDDDTFESKPFFTNSVGRFGMLGFAPGKTYRVTFDQERSSFEFTIPDDSTGLLRLDDLDVPAVEEEKGADACASSNTSLQDLLPPARHWCPLMPSQAALRNLLRTPEPLAFQGLKLGSGSEHRRTSQYGSEMLVRAAVRRS